jgi:hypothetical protein
MICVSCLRQIREDRLKGAVSCGCERAACETKRGVLAHGVFAGMDLSHFGLDKSNVAHLGNGDRDYEPQVLHALAKVGVSLV